MIIGKLIESLFKFICQGYCVKFLGTAVTAVATALLAWNFLVPGRPDADLPRKKIADRAILKMMEDLRQQRGEIKHVAVMHFVNDGSDYVTRNLRSKLASSGIFEVEEADLWEKICGVLKLRISGSFAAGEIVKYGKKFNVQAVIAGNLDRFESRKGDAVITGTLRLIGIPGGNIIAEIPIKESSAGSLFGGGNAAAPSSSPSAADESAYPWHIRFLIFVLAVLLLPVMTISFIRCMVAKRSNSCNAFVLSVYTAADLILAYFMVGGLNSTFCTVIFLAAGGLAFLYNASVMSFALKLES